MKDKDIQLLIDKYLDGATTSDEERRLAVELLRTDIPKEWVPIRMMLGELTMGEAVYDHIMAERQSQQSTMSHKKQWKWIAMVAVAASLAIILLLAWPNGQSDRTPVSIIDEPPTKVEEKKEDVLSTTTDDHNMIAEARLIPEVETVTKTTAVKTVMDNHAPKPKKESNMEQPVATSSNDTLYEDTLGTGIWKDERKVKMALELLSDCEKTIVQSKKAIRNGVVEVSFKALPQRQNRHLVIDEDGNYVITEDTQPSPISL